jgi:hypothetical protein
MTNPYNPIWGAYSFMDVYAVIDGPGAMNMRIGSTGIPRNPNGIIIGGPMAASAEEGITLALQEETNTMTVGADGSVMHSLHASRSGTATFRLLKISPYNNALMALYNFQRLQSNRWGRNVITIEDFSRGDKYVLLGAAFVRFPNNSYAKVGNTIEWEFHIAIMDPHLGLGEWYGGEAYRGMSLPPEAPPGFGVPYPLSAAGAAPFGQPVNPVGVGPIGPRRTVT